MTYLELVQQLFSETGTPGTAPTTVVGNTGDVKRLCDWVRQAWTELQGQNPTWEWLRNSFSFDTTSHKQSYSLSDLSLTALFGSWRNESFRIYLTSTGVNNETWLQQYEYNSFRDYYLLGARKNSYGRPIAISIAPDKSLVFGLVPDNTYTVGCEYYRTPVILTADTDTPAMPSRFHMAIVYKAMMSFGAFYAAAEVYQRGEVQLSAMLNWLQRDQLPMPSCGGSLI